MQQSKQFLKLPATGRQILTEFMADNDKHKLLKNILKNIDSQLTINSKFVRRSTFRGLLRKHFKLTNEQMKPIESNTTDKQLYHDTLQASVNSQHIDIINKELLQKLLNHNQIGYLLLTSGLRINELLSSESKIVDEKIFFKITKKQSAKFYMIDTIIKPDKWYQLYKIMKLSIAGRPATSVMNGLNKQLKKIIPTTFYKRSSHIYRAIYVKYKFKFQNQTNQPTPQTIRRLLHHENFGSSAHYDYIKLDDDVDDLI